MGCRLSIDAVTARDVDELKNERTTSDNSSTSGQEVSSDYVLQYRRLSATLRTDDDLFFFRRE